MPDIKIGPQATPAANTPPASKGAAAPSASKIQSDFQDAKKEFSHNKWVPVGVAAAVTSLAYFGDYLPHGPAGLVGGAALFGISAAVTMWGQELIPFSKPNNPEELAAYKLAKAKQKHPAKHIAKGVILGAVALAFFPAVMNAALNWGIYSPDSAAVRLAHNDAKMIGLARDKFKIPTPGDSSSMFSAPDVNSIGDVYTRGAVQYTGSGTAYFYKTGAMSGDATQAKPTGKVVKGQVYCAAFAGNGLLAIKQSQKAGSTVFTPQAEGWEPVRGSDKCTAILQSRKNEA